jgi:hypothetical protein
MKEGQNITVTLHLTYQVIMSGRFLKKIHVPTNVGVHNKQIINHQKGGEGDASIHHQTH